MLQLMRLVTVLDEKAMIVVRTSPSSGRRCRCPVGESPSHALLLWKDASANVFARSGSSEAARGVSPLAETASEGVAGSALFASVAAEGSTALLAAAWQEVSLVPPAAVAVSGRGAD